MGRVGLCQSDRGRGDLPGPSPGEPGATRAGGGAGEKGRSQPLPSSPGRRRPCPRRRPVSSPSAGGGGSERPGIPPGAPAGGGGRVSDKSRPSGWVGPRASGAGGGGPGPRRPGRTGSWLPTGGGGADQRRTLRSRGAGGAGTRDPGTRDAVGGGSRGGTPEAGGAVPPGRPPSSRLNWPFPGAAWDPPFLHGPPFGDGVRCALGGDVAAPGLGSSWFEK